MIPSDTGSVPEKFPRPKDGVVDGDAHGPMPQQDSVGCHGHEMHPQKFVQLVGCHDAKAAKHHVTDSPH